jgi:hypothetical protein
MYAILLYLLCALLFPDDMSDYSGFRNYFYSRKKWIFSFMALLFSVDVADTLLKGLRYFRMLGPVQPGSSRLGPDRTQRPSVEESKSIVAPG